MIMLVEKANKPVGEIATTYLYRLLRSKVYRPPHCRPRLATQATLHDERTLRVWLWFRTVFASEHQWFPFVIDCLGNLSLIDGHPHQLQLVKQVSQSFRSGITARCNTLPCHPDKLITSRNPRFRQRQKEIAREVNIWLHIGCGAFKVFCLKRPEKHINSGVHSERQQRCMARQCSKSILNFDPFFMKFRMSGDAFAHRRFQKRSGQKLFCHHFTSDFQTTGVALNLPAFEGTGGGRHAQDIPQIEIFPNDRTD